MERSTGSTRDPYRFARWTAGVATVWLVVELAVIAWPFGSVHASSVVWLLGATTVALAVTAVFLWTSGRPGRVPTLSLPALALVFLAAVQLLALPTAWRGGVAAEATRWRAELGAEGGPATLTLSPAETRRELVNVVHAVGVFVVATWCAAEWPLVVGWALAATGGAVAFFGLVQRLSWNGLIYWSVPLTGGGQPFGPFVNRNHAGAFLEVCLAGALMTVLVETSRRSGASRTAARARLFAAGTLAVLIASGLIVSQSRGTWLATAVGGLVVLPFAGRLAARREGGATTRRTKRTSALRAGSVLGFVLLGVAGTWGLVAWSGQTDSVRARAETLTDVETTVAARWGHWQATAVAAESYLPFGSGLGSHRHVVAAHATVDGPWYQHAENEYLDVLLELGWPGVALLVLGFGFTLLAIRNVLRKGATVDQAVGCAAVFGGVALAVHSGFDFAIRIPAVAVAAATLLGLLAGRALRGAAPGWNAIPVPRIVGAGFAVLICAIGVVGTVEAARQAEVERTLAEVRETNRGENEPWSIDTEQRHTELDRLERLSIRVPYDADVQLALASARSRLLRSEWLDRREVTDADDRRRAWRAWSNVGLYELLAHPRSRVAGTATSKLAWTLRADPLASATLSAIRDDLRAARSASPLRSEPHLRLIPVDGVLDPDGDIERHVERALHVAPADAGVHLALGRMHLRAGRKADAAAAWKRSLTLSRRHERAIIREADGAFDPATFVTDVLPNDAATLTRWSTERFTSSGPGADAVRRLIAERSLRLLGDASDTAETWWLRATAHEELGDNERALLAYAEAVERRPSMTTWRTAYAESLFRAGREAEALEQARASLAAAPLHEKPQIAELLRRIRAGENPREEPVRAP